MVSLFVGSMDRSHAGILSHAQIWRGSGKLSPAPAMVASGDSFQAEVMLVLTAA